MIGLSGPSWQELEQAEAYNLGMSHISSKTFFLSDLLRALRKGFHSSLSIASTVLKEGIVLPIYFTATTTDNAAFVPILW